MASLQDPPKYPASLAGKAPVVFETRHRVRFREIDPYGHMNMAHYLLYYSDHRFEGMRTFIGLGLKEIDELPIAFHIRSVEIEYLKPLIADQEFVIRSFVGELKRGSCIVDFKMLDRGLEPLSTASMRIGCIDKTTGRPIGWPDGLMERFFK
jgi:acyl-CoA thioester hydrolase